MKTSEVNNSLIGKRCTVMSFGILKTGTIIETNVTEHTAGVFVELDTPTNWGGEFYSIEENSARLSDEFGSLKHVTLIDTPAPNLNINEKLVLAALQQNAYEYGEDNQFVADEAHSLIEDRLTMNQFKGFLSSLSKKGFIEVEDGGYFDGQILKIK